MKVALYARVSTKDKGQSVEVQLPPLHEYVKSRGWEVVRVFTDDVSAVKKRPNFELMIKEAKERKFDVVIVWKLDRFARSISDFVMTLQVLDSAGVRFIATTQGIDTDKANPTSRLTMHILAAMAEFERSLISERVKAGIARVQSKGVVWGRKRQVLDMEVLRRLRGEGKSFSEIAKAVGSSSTVVFDRLKEAK